MNNNQEFANCTSMESHVCPVCGITIHCLPGQSMSKHNDDHMVGVVPHLYIGSICSAYNLFELNHFKIDNIINATCELDIENKYIDKFEYKRFMWNDTIKFNILQDLDLVTSTIHNAITNNKNVLVHCIYGISRSPSIIIAYLIKYHNMSYDDALKCIKDKRAIVRPNNGFVNQLKQYELINK